MRVAVLSFAHMHAYSYAGILHALPGVELAAVADPDEDRGTAAARRFGTRYTRDYQEILASDVDAVIVCSENRLHAEIVVAAAEAGKHVLCEKPLATRVEDAERMIAACRKAGVKLQTAFPMRFSTPVRHVKDQIDSGQIGRILAMNGTNRGQNPGGWFVQRDLAGGGAVMDHTVHVIDLMRWYTASEVAEVYAEVDTRFAPADIDDCGLLTLEFQNGVIAAHDPSWSRPKTYPTWGDVTLRVTGTEGVVTLDAFAQRMTHYDEETRAIRWIPWGDNPDRLMIEGFIRSIREDTVPPVTGEDGLRALEVALAAYESARTGKPVRLR